MTSSRLAVAALTALVALGGARRPAAVAGPPPASPVERERATIERSAQDAQQQRARVEALKALGEIGGPAAAEVACSVLDDPFLHVRDHAVSALMQMLRAADAAATRDWLAKKPLVDRAKPAVRLGVATALGLRGGPEAAPALAAALAKESDPAVAHAIVLALERLGVASAAPALTSALGSRDGAVAGAAARALGRVAPSASVVEALRGLLAAKDPLARAGAVDGLAAADPAALEQIGHEIAVDAAVEPRIALAEALGVLASEAGGRSDAAAQRLDRLLADSSWRVRAAALEAELVRWDKAVIPVVIARLHVEKGRLRRDAARVLHALSGVRGPIETDADLWESWWKGKDASFDIGARPTPDRHGHVRRTRSTPGGDIERWSGVKGGPETAAFFRLPIVSARLSFLFDLSGSMRDAADDGRPGTKVERARAEFSKTLDLLPRETAFDLLVYRYPSAFPPSPRLTRALGALTPAGAPTAVRKATEWLAKEQPKGWGAFYDGLVLASVDDVDTIVLLSDGVPSMGTYDRGFRIVDEFVRANRFRRVAVDTVLVGREGVDREFMQELADATGGTFQEGLR